MLQGERGSSSLHDAIALETKIATLAKESLDPLLLRLFEAPTTASWDAWLADTARHFGSTVATLAPLDASPNGWMGGVVVDLSLDRREAYQQHFHDQDAYVQRLALAEPDRPVLMSLPAPAPELLTDEFFNDDKRHANHYPSMAVTFDCGDTRFMLSFGREATDGGYDAEDLEALGYLTGFVKRALNTQRLVHLMDALSGASYQAMDTSRLGILLLDGGCRVLYANRIASDLLTAEEVIGIRNGRLAAMQPSGEQRLGDAFDRATLDPGEPSLLMLQGPRSSTQVMISIARLASPGPTVLGGLDLGVSMPTYAIMANTLEPAEVGVDQLSAIYGLTSREADVTSLLVGGRDLDEIAKALSIGRETVRFHLKNVFAKTGTHSQRGLVLEVASTIPPGAVRPSNSPRP